MINPCGHTYCKLCLDRIDREKTGCPECRGPIKTKIENRGFLNLIAEMRLKDKRADAKEKFYKIQALLSRIEKEPVINPVAYVEAYFASLKSQVSMHCEETVEQVKTKSKRMIEQLDSLEKEAKSKIDSIEKVDTGRIVKSSMPEWEKQLNAVNISVSQVEDLLKQLAEGIGGLENAQSDYEHSLLMKSKIQFVPTLIDDKLFGSLSISRRLDDPNGFYLGEVVNGRGHGKGEYHYNDGDTYVGEYRDHRKCGKGVYVYANGERYEGEWKEDSFCGQGTYSWSDGQRYEGGWRENRMSGRGTFYFSNGDRMEGPYSNGEANGQFIYYHEDGTIQRTNYVDDEPVDE